MSNPSAATPILVFSAFAYLVDALNLPLSGFQSTLITSVTNFYGAIAAGVITLIGLFEAYVYDFGVFDATATGLVLIFSIQVIISLFTLVLFYSIVYISPKGTFTLADCLLAPVVFLLESIPILCGFSFWGAFALYLRRSTFSGFSLKNLRR